ncbi:MAG TPA: hypothetical protein VJZ71_10760 [Phycisphaerae bacterium]|nr:hypothetical protein [Phycisphaerae bacterium]
MAGPYIPTRLADRRAWFDNFTSLIAADPPRYAMTPSDGQYLADLFTEWDASYTVATAPETRTPVTVAQFAVVRAQVEPTIRTYAMFIKANFGVTPEDKVALGLNLDNPGNTPIPAPSTNPLLSMVGATQGEHTIRYADQNTPDKRAKPFGAAMILIFANIADEPDGNPLTAKFIKVATVNPVAVQYSPADNGKTATLFGRWVTRRGLVGPWSPFVSFTIAS